MCNKTAVIEAIRLDENPYKLFFNRMVKNKPIKMVSHLYALQWLALIRQTCNGDENNFKQR